MMTKQDHFLYRTDYFGREWTWIRRLFAAIVLGIGCFLVPVSGDFQFIRYAAVVLVIFYYIAKPKDDLAVTRDYLLHLRRSVIDKFTRIDKYDLSEIVSIRCGGIHSDGWELVDVFNGGGNTGGYYNTVEMTFRNGESRSLMLPIDRKKLDIIVKLVYDVKKRVNA